MIGSIAYKLAIVATHRGTYHEFLVAYSKPEGKNEAKLGIGKLLSHNPKRQNNALVIEAHEEKTYLTMLYEMFGESWSFETVAAHTVGV